MKFDSNLAWKRATSAISANRDVVYILAGVFFLLPGLAMALLLPAPAPTAGLDEEAAMALVSEYYVSMLPFAIPMVLIQATGTLALLTLLTDRSRPTVSEAIGKGVKGIVPYLLAQLILGLGIGLVGGVILALGAATGLAALTVLGLLVVGGLVVYMAVRTSLVGPVIAVEGERNPVAALKRSWQLTSGNVLRIAIFFALVVIAFFVVIIAITAIAGVLVALFASAHVVEVVGAVISAALNAVMVLYFVGILAATHRQLAGASPQAESSTFD